MGPDAGDTKSSVQGYITKYSVKYPMTYKTTANDAILSYNSAGSYPCVLLIKPDKTYINVRGKTIAQIKALCVGAQPATCGSTAINDLNDLNNAINVYPNPSSGNFDIALENSISGNVSLEITNVLGQIVFTDNIDKGTNSRSYDFSSYPKGLYSIKLNSNEGTVYKKLILK